VDPLPLKMVRCGAVFSGAGFRVLGMGSMLLPIHFPLIRRYVKPVILLKRTSSGRLEMVIRCNCYKTLGSVGLHWIEGLFLWTCQSLRKVCLSPTISFLIGIGIFLHRGLAKAFPLNECACVLFDSCGKDGTNWISFLSAKRIILFLTACIRCIHRTKSSFLKNRFCNKGESI
jgi:hypothetical protein